MPEQLFKDRDISIHDASIEPPQKEPSLIFDPRQYFTIDDAMHWLEMARENDQYTRSDKWRIYLAAAILFPEIKEYFSRMNDEQLEELETVVSNHLPSGLMRGYSVDTLEYDGYIAGLRFLRWVLPQRVPEQEIPELAWEYAEWSNQTSLENNEWAVLAAQLASQKIIWPQRFADLHLDIRYLDAILAFIDYLKSKRQEAVNTADERATIDLYVRRLVCLKIIQPGLVTSELYNEKVYTDALRNIEDPVSVSPPAPAADMLRLVRAASQLYLLSQGEILIDSNGVEVVPRSEMLVDQYTSLPLERRY